MTLQPTATALETLYRLLDFMGARGMAANALPAALAWLVLGRLSDQGRAPSLGAGFDRDPLRIINVVKEVDAPSVLRDALSKALADWSTPMSNEAAYIVRQLLNSPTQAQWDLQDAAWVAAARARNVTDTMGTFDPLVCDLAVASLCLNQDDHVWVPFDTSGQFTVRLATKGVRVWRAGPGYESPMLTALLLALCDDPYAIDRVTFTSELPHVSGEEEVSKCLIAAPMGVKISSTHPWRQWQAQARQGRALWIDSEELDRSDAWAVTTMWPQVRDRGVFLTSPSLLFAHGQEQRLRKALLLDPKGNMVVAVAGLPSGSIGGASVAPAMLVLDARERGDQVRMVDVGGLDGRAGTASRLRRDVDSATAATLLLSADAIPQIAGDVSLGEIEKCDFSLVPQRYLRRVDDLKGERCTLSDLVTQVVRSPVPTKDPNGWPVWEIGIPRLDQWRPVASGYERFMQITPRKADEVLLREGDLVLSIKGTVGKAGIVGLVPATYDAARTAELEATPPPDIWENHNGPKSSAAVAAASCIGLRVNRQKVLPEYLLLYLRSEDFKRQLEALRVGSTIAHITPATLLSGVQVLLMPMEEQRQLCERYEELCDVEERVEHLQRQMRETRDALFPTVPHE